MTDEGSSIKTGYDRGKLKLRYHYLDMVPKGRDEGNRGP
jgi:hypothetical protein